MSLLLRPEPFATDFTRLFDSLFEPRTLTAQRWLPAMDLVEADDHYVLKADLPGLTEDEVAIEFADGVLTLSGERKAEYERKEKGFVRLERSFGKFSRSLSLPDGINADAIAAHFHNGVLEITIPKPEERKPRRITVSANGNGKPATIEGTTSES
jgi:HSP20 family protein